jgi:hypothetical protein
VNEYETIVGDIISRLVGGTPALLPSQVSGGATNTITGASGFAHQVDVSVRAHSFLVLVECKYWSRPVDAEAVLVLASRLADIRAADTSLDVSASVVSTKGATRGAQILADYFSIILDEVKSVDDYGVRLRNQIFRSVGETLLVSDSYKVELNPPDDVK